MVDENFSIEKYDGIMNELRNIKVKKGHDYGTLMWDLLGIKGVFSNIMNKTLRLYNMVWRNQNNNYESTRDTLLDLANYCIIGIQEIDRKNVIKDEEISEYAGKNEYEMGTGMFKDIEKAL